MPNPSNSDLSKITVGSGVAAVALLVIPGFNLLAAGAAAVSYGAWKYGTTRNS